MRINYTGEGTILIDGDEKLLAKIEADPSLEGVDVSDLRVCADSLAQLYNMALSAPKTDIYTAVNGERVLIKTEDNVKRYALMKQEFLETFSV